MNTSLTIKRLLKLTICNILFHMKIDEYFKKLRNGKITILMYHRICHDDDVHGLIIRPENFEKQIEYLTKNYAVISLQHAVNLLRQKIVDNHYIVITFDDGYRDNYDYAYPILKKYNTPATLFLTCEAIQQGTFDWHSFDSAILGSSREYLDLEKHNMGKVSIQSISDKEQALLDLHRNLKRLENSTRLSIMREIVKDNTGPISNERIMLNRNEIDEMIKSGLITVGSHTVTHPILTRVSKEQAWEEVGDSKRILEEFLGCPVDFFSYPNGGPEDFDKDIEEIVNRSGYKAACSTIPGVNTKSASLFNLKRIDVTNNVCLNLSGAFSESLFAIRISGITDGLIFRR